jgi:hypothetical protein
MNYDIRLCGKYFDEFDTIVKLLITSAEESDYQVKTYSYMPNNIKAPLILKVKLIGSLKKSYESIIVDFDRLVLSYPEDSIYLSPESIEINQNNSSVHYWHLFGQLFSKIQDMSPAFVTG